MKKAASLSSIRPFNDVYFRHCFYHSLLPTVTYYQQSVLPILLNGVPSYSIHDNCIRIDYPSEHTLEEQLRDMGIQMIQYQQVPDILLALKQSIVTGCPAVVWIDCYYDRYRRELYRQEHLSHTLLVYGYDDDRSVFLVLEHSHRDYPLTYTSTEIDYETVAAAYQGYCSNFCSEDNKISHFVFALERKRPRHSMEELQELYREQIALSLDWQKTSQSELQRFISHFCRLLQDEESFRKDAKSLTESVKLISLSKKVEQYIASEVLPQDFILSELHSAASQLADQLLALLFKFIYSQKFKATDAKKMEEKIQAFGNMENKLFAYRYPNQQLQVNKEYAL